MADQAVLEQCALHVAKTELALRAKGNDADADRAHNRLVDLIEGAPDSYVLGARVVRRLGRVNALAVGFDKDAIEQIVRSTEAWLACR